MQSTQRPTRPATGPTDTRANPATQTNPPTTTDTHCRFHTHTVPQTHTAPQTNPRRHRPPNLRAHTNQLQPASTYRHAPTNQPPTPGPDDVDVDADALDAVTASARFVPPYLDRPRTQFDRPHASRPARPQSIVRAGRREPQISHDNAREPDRLDRFNRTDVYGAS